MREIRSETTINGPVERVWETLTDLDSFSTWNPFVQRASGNVSEGEKLNVYLKAPGGMGMTFKPQVVKAAPNSEFRWLVNLLMPGIFDGEHIFELEPAGDDGCRFVQREEFRGVLVPLMLAMVGKSTERGFLAMNQALKSRVEGTGQT
jgi:hypothetical protein